MIALDLKTAADAMQGRMQGEDRRFIGVSTDSRHCQAGNLFVALSGEHFDAHNFIAAAQARGAVAATVSREVAADIPLLQVDDTRLALGRLAAHWRQQFAVPLVAVTGSNGKTTVKEMLAAVFGQQAPVLATRGNLNNDIGVPLTLFGLGREHQAAVIEMGANHAGEIAYLMQLARPSVSVLNNAGAAHLEGFGSLEGVARAKGEIIRHLQPQATAVINADDRFAAEWQAMVPEGCELLRFGLQQSADVSARFAASEFATRLQLNTPLGNAECRLALPGEHNVMNALAATAAAIAAGVALPQIVEGLASLQGVAGRLQRRQRKDGLVVIDDSYNANPGSTRSAIDVLAAQSGIRCLVLGDMGELGSGAADLHAGIGRYAREKKIDALFTLGELAAHASEAFGQNAEAYADAERLIARLSGFVEPGMTVLVKGSRLMHMERVADALLAAAEAVH